MERSEFEVTREQDGEGGEQGEETGRSEVGPDIGPVTTESEEIRWLACVSAASLLYQVPMAEIRGRSRRHRRIVEGRQLAEYLLHVGFGMTYEAMSEVTHKDRTSIRHNVERVEDRRENPHFDAALTAMETFLGCLEDHDILDGIENGLGIDHEVIAYIPHSNETP